MGRLYIIDQSLCSQGGHHFDYVNCVARAAKHEQLETFVGSNRKFLPPRSRATANTDLLHQTARIIPGFRNTTYQKVSWLAGLRHLKRVATNKDTSSDKKGPLSVKRYWQQYRSRAFRKKRREIIAQFACDCSRFFGTALKGDFQRGDHVFLTTVSELELMGLAIYLSSVPSSSNATWHLQFHFNLFDGRTPEFDSQNEVQRKVRGCFLAALSRVPDHDLNFYCTSNELVEQYTRLKVADFWQLPYPINQRFAPVNSSRKIHQSNSTPALTVAQDCGAPSDFDSEPIDFDAKSDNQTPQPRLLQPPAVARMVVPGELRREKGSVAHLQKVVDGLWDEYLSCGRLQIAAQRPKRKFLRKEKLELRLPTSNNIVGGEPIIDYQRHPLSEDAYCDLIRGADFGLLLHDSRAYYSRRAGVLGELLSCGKPVVVPAGCWMAHQIQESQFQHIDRVVKQLSGSQSTSRQIDLQGLKFDSANAPLSGGVVSFDRQRYPFSGECSKSEEENIVVVSFDWQHPRSRGVDARIRCIEYRDDGTFESASQVVGHRIARGKCRAIFRTDFGGNKIRLEIENAFHDSTASVRNLGVDLFQVANPTELPLGSLGLIYSDVESIESFVAEMVENLDHYRFHAEEFSHRWWQTHAPRRTIEFLLNQARTKLKVA